MNKSITQDIQNDNQISKTGLCYSSCIYPIYDVIP